MQAVWKGVTSMENKMVIQQSNNMYRIWHPYGYVIAEIMMPNDGQYFLDTKALAAIGKALANRYDLK